MFKIRLHHGIACLLTAVSMLASSVVHATPIPRIVEEVMTSSFGSAYARFHVETNYQSGESGDLASSGVSALRRDSHGYRQVTADEYTRQPQMLC